MTEKLNSGFGGYICDRCSTLLWSGLDGIKNPINRRYIYRVRARDVIVRGGLAFCSKACSELAEQEVELGDQAPFPKDGPFRDEEKP